MKTSGRWRTSTRSSPTIWRINVRQRSATNRIHVSIERRNICTPPLCEKETRRLNGWFQGSFLFHLCEDNVLCKQDDTHHLVSNFFLWVEVLCSFIPVIDNMINIDAKHAWTISEIKEYWLCYFGTVLTLQFTIRVCVCACNITTSLFLRGMKGFFLSHHS